MLKLIIGVKGTGKTKTLIQLVNDSLASSTGAVVCVEKGVKLRYDVNYQCRLINTEEYLVSDAKTLYGFVAGMLASNHDITDLFIDSALKICENKPEDLDSILDMLAQLSDKYSTNIVMTASIPTEEASATVKKYI